MFLVVIVRLMRVLRTGDIANLPWKNGLGVSHVIAAEPANATDEALRWQVSTTGIKVDCPFSSLPGIDRNFTLLEGEGVELDCRDASGRVEVRHTVQAQFAPFEFRGDWTTRCRLLGGPVRVLNVMTRRGHVAAKLEFSHRSASRQSVQPSGETLIAIVLTGAMRVEPETSASVPGSARAIVLIENEALQLSAPEGERIECAPSGTEVCIALIRLQICGAPPLSGAPSA